MKKVNIIYLVLTAMLLVVMGPSVTFAQNDASDEVNYFIVKPKPFDVEEFIRSLGDYADSLGYLIALTEVEWTCDEIKEKERGYFIELHKMKVPPYAKEVLEENKDFQDKLDTFIRMKPEYLMSSIDKINSIYKDKLEYGKKQGMKEGNSCRGRSLFNSTIYMEKGRLERFRDKYGTMIDKFIQENSGSKELKK